LTDLAASIRDSLNLDGYLLEYPGYGQRGGTPSEASLLAAADEGWETLPTNRPGYVVSESLGTGVAAHLAQKYPTQVAGLLMFVPYDRLASVAQSHYPFLPAYLLLQDRFAPVDWLADYHGPVKIVLAGADQVIPIARGQALYDGYRGPKSLQIVPGAGHGDTIEQSPQWWREVMQFWDKNGLNSWSEVRKREVSAGN
jgi:pimeloyl-ACP methyl ester carboxylesterase